VVDLCRYLQVGADDENGGRARFVFGGALWRLRGGGGSRCRLLDLDEWHDEVLSSTRHRKVSRS
jgi:hypothetical protein